MCRQKLSSKYKLRSQPSLLVVQDNIRKPHVSGGNAQFDNTFILCRIP